MRRTNYQIAALLTASALAGGVLHAKDKQPKAKPAAPQDQIVVESQLPNAAGPVTRFVATRHFGRSYVYAEREAGEPVTLIDVTNPHQPVVLSQANLPSGSLLAVAGTAALAGTADGEKHTSPQTIRLMDFSDPANPKVTKEFANVTAVQTISGGMVLLANSDGIWILAQHLAEDPATEERYARKVIYGESMY